MATITRERLRGCDGFRIETDAGLIGWVEETWLGPASEPAALAVRAVDGRRALLLADDVDAILEEAETVIVHGEPRLLELEAPRIAGARLPVSASWSTTGALIEPPRAPGFLRRLLLGRRPWRLGPPPGSWTERPLWQVILLLYAGIILLAALVMTLAFSVAQALA
jgi:hypothetical protein